MNKAFQVSVVLAGGLLTGAAQAQVVDPGQMGPRATSASTYGSFTTQIDVGTSIGMVEFLAKAYYPTSIAANEKLPLVLILHGDHTTCYNVSTNVAASTWPCTSAEKPIPNYLGYEYLAPLLASHGMIVASLSLNAINARDDGGMTDGTDERQRMITEHLNFWTRENSGPTGFFGAMFVNHVDLSRVAEVGHSLGGKAVVAHATQTPPPGLRAVMAIAPAGSASAPLINKPLAVMVGYCDGDVGTLIGVTRVDAARYVNPDDEAAKYTFLLYGGNHNHFNRMWTPGEFPAGTRDDGGTNRDGTATNDPHCDPRLSTNRRVSAQGQRDVAKGYAAAFLRRYLLDDMRFEAILKGYSALPGTPTNGTVFVGHIPPAPDRKDVNQVRDATALGVNNLGGVVQCNGHACPSTALDARVCKGATCLADVISTGRKTHFGTGGSLNAYRLIWTSSGGRLSNLIPDAHRDLSNFRRLQFRVGQNPRSPAPAMETASDFSIRLVGADGRTSSVRAQNQSNGLYYPAGGAGKKAVVMNTLGVPLTSFTGVDLHNITSIDIMMNQPTATASDLLVSDMALVDPIVYGYGASFSDTMTYGVRTGSSHASCDWFSSTQVCTVPSSDTIHWCWEPAMVASNRSRMESLVPMLAAPAGKPVPLSTSTDLGFTFVKHDSCNDSVVQLVIDDRACSGNNSSNMSGYVCTTFPPVSDAKVLTQSLSSAAGNYYSWGLDGGWTVLHLDVTDMATNFRLPALDTLLTNAIYHGLGWIIGLGSRTDTTSLYTSAAVQPLSKTGWSAPEVCRARSFRFAPDAGKLALLQHCGSDLP
jgi:dienelactone hydrolase